VTVKCDFKMQDFAKAILTPPLNSPTAAVNIVGNKAAFCGGWSLGGKRQLQNFGHQNLVPRYLGKLFLRSTHLCNGNSNKQLS